MEFHKTHTDFVVIEKSEEVLAHIHHIEDIPHLIADATEDETLVEAGIERARGLVASLGDDKDNVFIVLSARALNPRLRIIARCNEEENEEKLRKAGANEIVSPNSIGGFRMASILIRPTVVSFLDEMMQVTGETLRFEEVYVSDVPGLENHTLAQANIGRHTGLLVAAIKSENEMLHFNPGGQTVLKRDDILIVLGTRKQIMQLNELMCELMKTRTMNELFVKMQEEELE
jgi:voltage-gated potassium channel